MAVSGNPAIWGEAVRKFLLASQDRAAQEHQASDERARLDVAELKELERAEFYGEAPSIPEYRRSLLDRLLRRFT